MIAVKQRTQSIGVLTVSFAVIVLISCLLGGCPKGYRNLAVASDTIAHALSNAQQSIQVGVQDGVVSGKEFQEFNEYVVQASQAGLVLDQAIRQASSAKSGDITPQVNAFLDAFTRLNDQGILHIQNPKVRVAVSTALTGAEAAVAVIVATTQSGGKK